MITGTQIRAGMTILYNGVPHKVLSVMHRTPGNKRGFMQTKLRNLVTGLGCENRYASDEKVAQTRLDDFEMEYLYADGDDYHFMNTESFEQSSLTKDFLGDNIFYLTPNIKITVEFYEGNPVGVVPPKVVELKVSETAPNMKGATATSSNKPATLETGLVVNVPAFIEEGELIRVDTGEKKYIERAKQ